MAIQRSMGWGLLASFLLVGNAGQGADTMVASDPGTAMADVADLRDQLESGLRVSQQPQRNFIARVVRMVETRRLPLNLVMSTFKWARPKMPHAFPFFERGLRHRAAKLGIAI